MYYEYWGLKKHAFHNVPDPTMYFEMHESVESAVSEVLFAIEEGDECLAVIVGEVGLGKTMSLRMILDNLDEKKFRTVLITNPALTFPQLLREIIGQLTNTPCETQSKDRLLEEFHRLLVEANRKHKKVVILTDEANAITQTNLESMRLLTNLQADDHNLFTLVLAGQPQLADHLERPEMANLYQRIGIYSRLSKLESREIVKDYVEHRIERAGRTERIFTEDAIDTIWNHSEEGVPRLINRICKLALKAGETNELKAIDSSIIDAIGQRFKKRGLDTVKPGQEVQKANEVQKPDTLQKETKPGPEIEKLILLEEGQDEKHRDEVPETDVSPVVTETQPAQTKAGIDESQSAAKEPEAQASRAEPGSESDGPATEDMKPKVKGPATQQEKFSTKEALVAEKVAKADKPSQTEQKPETPEAKQVETSREIKKPVNPEPVSAVEKQAPESGQKSSFPNWNRERPQRPWPNQVTSQDAPSNRPQVSNTVNRPPFDPSTKADKRHNILTPLQNSASEETVPKVKLDSSQINNTEQEQLWDLITDVLRPEPSVQSGKLPEKADEKSTEFDDTQSEWQGVKDPKSQKQPRQGPGLVKSGAGLPDILASRDLTDEDARIEDEHNKEIIVGMRERFRRPQNIGY